MSGDRIGGSGSDTSSNAKRIHAGGPPRRPRLDLSRSGGWPTGSSRRSRPSRARARELGALAQPVDDPGALGSSSIRMDSPNCMRNFSPARSGTSPAGARTDALGCAPARASGVSYGGDGRGVDAWMVRPCVERRVASSAMNHASIGAVIDRRAERVAANRRRRRAANGGSDIRRRAEMHARPHRHRRRRRRLRRRPGVTSTRDPAGTT